MQIAHYALWVFFSALTDGSYTDIFWLELVNDVRSGLHDAAMTLFVGIRIYCVEVPLTFSYRHLISIMWLFDHFTAQTVQPEQK